MPGLLGSRFRRQRSVANACLVVGLSLWLFVHPATEGLKDSLHAFIGFLLGVSIALNLTAIRCRQRWQRSGAESVF